MTVETTSERTNISGHEAGEGTLADSEDLTDGVVAKTSDTQSTTLYLSADGQVDVTVEASPDGGETYFVLPESPVHFESAGDTAVHFRYDFNRLRLTASSAVNVTAQVREVF